MVDFYVFHLGFYLYTLLVTHFFCDIVYIFLSIPNQYKIA